MSVECRTSWVVVFAGLLVLTVGFGAPIVAVVGLKPIAEALDVPRSVPALAGSLAYLGSGLGGILMGWAAERLGTRSVAAFGLVMVAVGMGVSSLGGTAALLVGHGVFVGFLGLGAVFAPVLTLVSRWFDRRRGTAIAVVSSGQYLAGAFWPTLLEAGVDRLGWQQTMWIYGLLATGLALPLCLLLRAAPRLVPGTGAAGPVVGAPVLGMSPNMALGLVSAGIFLCCIPMAMPQGHIVAFCSDIGIAPARGAAMLSVMLALAFVSRQFWGWLADRMGGLLTVLAASTLQAVAMALFLATQDEAGLFAVAALFGMGFSGIVPAYVVAIRDLFPESEAGWRVPVLLLAGQLGMAAGGVMAGVIYDAAGAYAPAFAAGIMFNLLNLALIGWLAGRGMGRGPRLAPA